MTQLAQLGFFALDDSGALTVSEEAASYTVAAATTTTGTLLDAIRALVSTIDKNPVSERLLLDIVGRSGITNIQDAYNALEGAVATLLTRDDSLAWATLLYNRMPTQRRRDEIKDELQQFSTPPTIAALMKRVAAARESDVVLEPSAGSGLLVAGLKGKLILNELDARRRNVLRAVFPSATLLNHDARYLDATFSGTRPTVVVMNPPFSMDAANGAHGKDVGLDHVRAAVNAATLGARIVVLVGHNQHPERADWTPIIAGKASIRLALTIEGAAYYRMGTSFSTALIVLDKVPDLPTLASDLNALSLEALEAVLPSFPRCPTKNASSTVTTISQASARKTGATTFVPIFSNVAPLAYRYEPTHGEMSGERFVKYASTLKFEGASAHPADLVESLALGSVKLPPVSPETVALKLPTRATKGLSEAQLESIVYAQRAFQKTMLLPLESTDANDTNDKTFVEARRGILIGHGTGFGKARVICGTILANTVEGRTKALVLSENQDLCEDLRREWCEIAGEAHSSALINLTKLSPRDTIDAKAGILFATYATIRGEARQGSRSRKEQVLEWLGKDFDGVFAADEVHNCANALASKGERGKKNGSLQGSAVLWLQEQLPNARVMYLSATCASSVEAYAYAPRLGLWGKDSAFSTRNAFIQTMSAGGTGALELLARDLKARGLYLATSLSLEGIIVERLTHELTPDQIDGYNALARAWRIIYAKLDEIIKDTDSRTISSARSAIASYRQRSLQSYLCSAAMPTVMQHERQMLDEGFAIVGQLTNTYEAAQERALNAMEENDDLEQIDVSPLQIILDYLERVFPVAKLVPFVDDNGNERFKPLTDSNDTIIADPELVAQREDLKAKLIGYNVPDSILTIHLDTYGDRMAEVTGRKRRVVRKELNGEYKRVIETRNDHSNQGDIDAFQDGGKDVLLFSEAAGGTGRSYHSALNRGNQLPRAHYVLQTGWRSDRAIQGLGRTNRAAQAHKPRWILCETNAPGNKRFTSTIARRLGDLGAASQGQRDATTSGLFSEADNLESVYGDAAVRQILHSIRYYNEPMSYETWLEQTNLQLADKDGKLETTMPVSRFLNQVLSCDLGYNEDGPQNVLMDALVNSIREQIEHAKAVGKYDHGVQTIRALKIAKAGERAIHQDEDSGSTTLVDLTITQRAHRRSFGDVLGCVTKARNRFGDRVSGFQHDGEHILAFYRVNDINLEGKQHAVYTVTYPTHSSTQLDHAPNFSSLIGEDEARAEWEAALELLGDTVDTTEHIVTGSVLSIYHHLPSVNARVVSVTTESGERILGRVLNSAEAQSLVAQLTGQQLLNEEQIVERILKNRGAALYGGNIGIKFVRLANEPRIEVTMPTWEMPSRASWLSSLGCHVERINYVQRAFLPAAQTQAASVLASVMKGRPLVSIA
jgi:hypothetical protein